MRKLALISLIASALAFASTSNAAAEVGPGDSCGAWDACYADCPELSECANHKGDCPTVSYRYANCLPSNPCSAQGQSSLHCEFSY